MYETSLTHTPESTNNELEALANSVPEDCTPVSVALRVGLRAGEALFRLPGGPLPKRGFRQFAIDEARFWRLPAGVWDFGSPVGPSILSPRAGLGYAPCPHPLPSGGSRRSVSKHLEHFTLSIGRLRTRYNRGMADVKELSGPRRRRVFDWRLGVAKRPACPTGAPGPPLLYRILT